MTDDEANERIMYAAADILRLLLRDYDGDSLDPKSIAEWLDEEWPLVLSYCWAEEVAEDYAAEHTIELCDCCLAPLDLL